ncbi:AAA family ATPase [Ruegeria sp. SCPT10]|uniref:GumC family protein n=1 Tax=Ruegeria sp. SCP10 TaxID=3141377 RepID=UPI00333637F3
MLSNNGFQGGQSDPGEFVSIWLVIRRNLLPVAFLFGIAVILTSLYMRTVPDRYRTVAQMVLSLSETRYSDTTGRLETIELGRSSIETEIEKLKSRDFAGQVAETLGLFEDDSFVSRINPDTGLEHPAALHREAVIDKVLGSYSLSRAGESLAISVEGRSTDAELSAALANTVITQYISNELGERIDRLDKNIDDVRRRVNLLGEELTSNEADLANFIRSDNLDDEQLLDQLRSAAERARTILSIGLEQNVPPEEELALREELAAAEERLQLRTRQELTLLRKEREIELLRSRYQASVDELNLLETRSGQIEAGTSQVSVARVPQVPYAPNRALTVALAGAMSIMIGFVLALIREGLDRTIKTEKQIFNATGLQNLGYFVKQKYGPKGRAAAVFEPIENPRTPLAETARGILTNCIKFQHSKVVLVSSALPNEGKSFISTVLATTAAADGMNVALVDLDVYRKGATKLLIPDIADIKCSDLYSHDIVPQQVVGAQDAPGKLDLITVESPTRELTDDAEMKLRKLKDTLTSRYDLVVIDTPPALVMDEVYRNNTLIDAAILVVRWGRSPQDAVQAVTRRLSQADVNVIGTILNDVDPKKFRWIGYEGYYGHYDYYK